MTSNCRNLNILKWKLTIRESQKLNYTMANFTVIWFKFFTFCEPGATTGGLTEHSRTADAENNSLGMTENCGDLVTSGALNIHEVRIGVLHKPLQLVFPLFFFRPGVKQILGELKIGLRNWLTFKIDLNNLWNRDQKWTKSDRTSIKACSGWESSKIECDK